MKKSTWPTRTGGGVILLGKLWYFVYGLFEKAEEDRLFFGVELIYIPTCSISEHYAFLTQLPLICCVNFSDYQDSASARQTQLSPATLSYSARRSILAKASMLLTQFSAIVRQLGITCNLVDGESCRLRTM